MISIIIPTYNEEKCIGDILVKLKRGLTLPHEIIVTDDSSTDKTVESARPYADTVLVPEKKHATISANRNTGAAAAKGDILVFMDAGCYVTDPNSFFSKALADLQDRPRTVAVTAMIKILPEYETLGDKIVNFMLNTVIRVKDNVLNMGEAQGKFQMMRKTDFDRVGGFNEHLVTREDADMFQRLAKLGRTYCDPTLTVYHSGRRAHALGWPRLLSIWMLETFWVAVTGKARAKEWKDIR